MCARAALGPITAYTPLDDVGVVVCVAVGVVLVVRVVEADVVAEVQRVEFSLFLWLMHYIITEAVSRIVS